MAEGGGDITMDERGKLPVVILTVHSKKHKEINDYTQRRLTELGLKARKEYQIYHIPSGAEQGFPVPMIRINPVNPWGLESQTFYEKEGVEAFLHELSEGIQRRVG